MSISKTFQPVNAQLAYQENKLAFSAKKQQTINDLKVNLPASLASSAGIWASLPFSKFIMNRLIKDDSKIGISLNQVEEFSKDMVAKHKLAEKGFSYEILLKNKSDAQQARETLKKMCGGAGFIPLKDELLAGCKTLAVAIEERASLILHEIGHSVQYNNSKIGKLINKLRIDKALPTVMGQVPAYSAIAGIVLLLGMMHKPKEAPGKNNEKESLTNKITGFVKKHAFMLTFASFIPVLVDEGFATKHALTFLKEKSSQFLIPIRKNLGLAYLSYLGLAVFTSLGIKGGLMLKDKLVKMQSGQSGQSVNS